MGTPAPSVTQSQMLFVVPVGPSAIKGQGLTRSTSQLPITRRPARRSRVQAIEMKRKDGNSQHSNKHGFYSKKNMNRYYYDVQERTKWQNNFEQQYETFNE